MLRDPENYAVDILVNNPILTGIKVECLWNQMHSFHVSINIALDIMHDFIEKVCYYSVCAILSQLLRSGFLTLDNLNERVKFFDYGYDSGNKVVIITADHLQKEKLKMSASEMFFFVRHLGLMIGDFVPEGNEHWRLYVLLAEIMGIVTAPYVRKQSGPFLAALISEHHEVYKTVYGKTLKPKHHFMLHYPEVMNNIGPAINIWCMRMEGMHRPFVKRSARSHTCRKNLPLTTALKYCFSLTARFLAQ